MPLPAASTHDCGACQALCCVAPQISTRHGFPFDKPALEPCRHLEAQGFRCAIHATLAEAGCRGCIDFSCHGAGPLISRHAAGRGIDWTRLPPDHPQRRALLEGYLELHGLFSAYVDLQARQPPLDAELAAFTARLTRSSVDELLRDAVELAFGIRTALWSARLEEQE